MRRIVITLLIIIACSSLAGIETDLIFSPELLKEAKAKNPEAMYQLALCYDQGLGIAIDYKEAFYWLKKAAKKKNPDAQFMLSNYFFQNKVYKLRQVDGYRDPSIRPTFFFESKEYVQNSVEGFHWCKKAAEQGHLLAMTNLGSYYMSGKGVFRNPEKAYHWTNKAVGAGSILAYYHMANLYKEGFGVEQNYTEAFRFFMIAFNKGVPQAAYEIGNCYESGKGTEKDTYQAYYYYLIAGVIKHYNAQVKADMLRRELSAEQIKEAEQKRDSWAEDNSFKFQLGKQ